MVASLLIILIVCLSCRLDGLTGKLPDIGWREACGARLLAGLGLASEPLLDLAGFAALLAVTACHRVVPRVSFRSARQWRLSGRPRERWHSHNSNRPSRPQRRRHAAHIMARGDDDAGKVEAKNDGGRSPHEIKVG